MDYIALNTPAHGVVYNSEKSIGGIRYQAENSQRSVIIDKLNKKVLVKIQEQELAPPVAETVKIEPTPAKAELEISKHVEVTTDTTIQSEVLPVADATAMLASPAKEESFDASKEAKLAYEETMREMGITRRTYYGGSHRPRGGINYNSPFLVTVNGVMVDFAAEGVARPALSIEDKRWLMKAEKYFLTAKDENNRKIGSAKEYTSTEILEAFWATALTVGVEPKRFIVQLYNESRFNPHARGAAGERGIGQFMRNTAKMLDLNWYKMMDGENTYAYQARCAAEFVKSVGESRYNGGNPEYVRMISNRLWHIEGTDLTCSADTACV